MNKKDITIIKRLLKRNNGGIGFGITKDYATFVNRYYCLCYADRLLLEEEKSIKELNANGLSDTEQTTKTIFIDRMPEEKIALQIDLKKVKAKKRENRENKTLDPIAYDFQNGKTLYLNPSYLLDILEFTKTDTIILDDTRFNKNGIYNGGVYSVNDKSTTSAVLMPVISENYNGDYIKVA